MTRLELAPALAEEALFHVFDHTSGEHALIAREWRRERDEAYTLPVAEREAAFRALAARWILRLDLLEPMRRALAACPHAANALSQVQVRSTTRIHDEGSELYAPPAGHLDLAQGRRLVLSVRAERFADSHALFELSLREFLYADDMLNPSFGHRPTLPVDADEDPVRAQLAYDRYRVLWEARILGRMARARGLLDQSAPTPRFRRAFGAQADADELASLHDAAWSGRLSTLRELFECACAGCPASHIALR